MPGISQRGRKRPSPTISEDEQSDYPSSVSVGSKRARHAHDASESPPHTQSANLTDANAYVEDEFQAGSLVRVKLTNFVTYTAAEFHLGPSLNMVIGPNGTGKSTLVCAICLGLGWGSEHLGRAKDLGAFVKHGAAEAIIEIELAAGPGGGPNRIVTRTLNKADNKSHFTLNGKRATRDAVISMARSYSIQIDNLCQFLPQDRVVEFAKMTDVDRLRETQRAAAPPRMVEWHDQLKVLRSEERNVETRQKNEKAHLESLDKAQKSTKDDVERFHRREGLLQKSKCLKKVKPMIEIKLRKKDINQLKEDLKEARLERDTINVDMEPARQAQTEVETYRNQIEQVVKLRRNRVEMIKTHADKLDTKIEKDKAKAADCTTEIKAELNSKKGRDKDIVRVTGDIKRLDQQRQDEPVQYDAFSYEQRKAELRTQISSTTNLQVEKESTSQELRSRAHEMNQESKTLKEKQDQLNTQSGKKASLLQRLSPDTVTAWAWIEKNRNSLRFQGEVVGPPILECSISDARYAQAVESQLRKGDLLAITCTNDDDQKVLGRHLLGKQSAGGLGLHDVYLRTSPKPLSSYTSPVATEALAEYGFEGYMLDYIKGPDAVLAMLCDNNRMHQIAYTSTPISDEQYAAVSNSQIRTWVSGRETFKIVTRREYNASSTSVTKLRPAQWFVDQPGNTEETERIARRVEELRVEGLKLNENFQSINGEITKLKGEVQELKKAKDEVQAEQDAMKKAVAEWQALPGKIAQKQDQLDKYAQQNAETNNRMRNIKANARDTLLSVATSTLDHAKAVTQLRTFHESLVEAEIRFIEAKSELNSLIEENSVMLQKQRANAAAIDEMEKRDRALRKVYEEKRTELQQDIQTLTEQERDIVMEYRELPSLDALDEEIQAVNASLGLMTEGNPGAIKAYEKREEDMARTREKLEQYTSSLEETKEQIIEIRQQWEPKLDALIRKISDAFAHNFSKIGCAGEVEVYKDEEDFDNWSIQISVRFREGQPLSILNAHRQSGGERAVSTIFYLMALQDLAQSPFRVVDEINQGMDPRNERMVHERMVDIACQERTSQYFLITPKLLTGLKFHPKMKVHVINSGEHVPDANDTNLVKGGWDFKKMAKVALRTRKGITVA